MTKKIPSILAHPLPGGNGSFTKCNLRKRFFYFYLFIWIPYTHDSRYMWIICTWFHTILRLPKWDSWGQKQIANIKI